MFTASQTGTTARATLKQAHENYAQEAAAMQHLLVELLDKPLEIKMPQIRTQQARLDIASAAYRDAQEQYVREVLGSTAATIGDLIAR